MNTFFSINTQEIPRITQSKLLMNAISDVSAMTQAPLPMIYLTALSTASTALQWGVNVKTPTGKVSPISIMALTIAESGERKSTVENAFTKGVKSFEKKDRENHKILMEEYDFKMDLHNRKTTYIKSKVDLSDNETCDKMLRDLLANEKNKPDTPPINLTIFEDCTIEALLSELNENVPNGFLGSSEGGILLNSKAMGKTAHLNSIWSGDDVTVSRKSAETFSLTGGRLTVHIMAQKSVLERFLKHSKDDVRGNGFLSRFLFCAPNSTCGSRQSNGAVYSQEGLTAFIDRTSLLLEESTNLTNKKTIEFSNEAKKIWFDVSNDIELKMRSDGVFYNVKDHASKLAENIARVAAIIHCFEGYTDEYISAETLADSIALISYFSNQFTTFFNAPPKAVINVQKLEHWLLGHQKFGIRYLKCNTILQRGPSSIRKKRELEAALAILTSQTKVARVKYQNTNFIDLQPGTPYVQGKIEWDLSYPKPCNEYVCHQ